MSRRPGQRQHRCRALLFDMDGTLVQSGGNVEDIWRAWCERVGVSAQAVLSICHGMRSHEVLQRVAPQLDPEPELLWLETMELRHMEGVAEVAGAGALLHGLAGLPWALVTSASTAVARRRMALCGLPMPEVLVSSDHVRHGKPDPEPYLRAAQLLGVPAADCLAFEDAEAGIASALVAGCAVIRLGAADPAPDARLLAQLPDWRHTGAARAEGGAAPLLFRY
ncbi:HAD-IA family hydrolase [Roseateles sp. DAIF2]|uniref:HAD-IA family hydrolase n=1 Tax=Roseateles sp. DAIF2 TaxID=2714952 RepID=UPI001BCA5E02|nr:HAD-IA family hydrolase [Roseateles sp. DAIF2]